MEKNSYQIVMNFGMKELEGEDIFSKIKKKKWMGHLWRAEEKSKKYLMLQWRPGRKKKGRPRLGWLQEVGKDLSNPGIKKWKEKTKDRKLWRNTWERICK